MWWDLLGSLGYLGLFLCLLPVFVLLYKHVVAPWFWGESASKRVTSTLYPYGVADAIGRRPYMEDRYLIAGRLHDDPTACLYAVFDGHGGSKAAQYCVDHMVHHLITDQHYPVNPTRALTNAFLQTDSEFLVSARAHRPPLDDGTTSVVALVLGNQLWVANAGDSRAILVQQQGHHVPMSEDHKPNRPDETARIKRAGGTVYFHGVWRVGGILAVSRAIGDRILKPYVTAEPEIRQWRVTPADQYLILASDGLWDVISNDEVAQLVNSISDPQFAAHKLVREALARNSADNVTCVVIDLQRPKYRDMEPEPQPTSADAKAD